MYKPTRPLAHRWLILAGFHCLLALLRGEVMEDHLLNIEVFQKNNLEPLRSMIQNQEPKALDVLFKYSREGRWGGYAKSQVISELFLSHPGAEEFVRQKLKTLSNLQEDAEARSLFFWHLRNMRRRWVLDLVGEVLETKLLPTTNLPPEKLQELISDPFGSFSDSPNYYYAAKTMWYLRPAHFPFRFDPEIWRLGDIEVVCTWWEANKHQPDSFFFDGSIDYTKEPVWEDPPWFKRTPGMAPWPLKPDDPHPVIANAASVPKPEASPITTPRETVTSFWPAFLIGTCMLLSVFFVLIKRGQN